MSERAAALAAAFESANNDVIAAVEGCTPDQWGRTCADEGWAVGRQMFGAEGPGVNPAPDPYLLYRQPFAASSTGVLDWLRGQTGVRPGSDWGPTTGGFDNRG